MKFYGIIIIHTRLKKIYSSWILRYVEFYGSKTHPKDMGKNEVDRFLSYLTEKKDVLAATRNQALNALVFLYKKVLDIDLENGTNIRIVQKLMGHNDVKTTEIYTHVMKKYIDSVRSPLDFLWQISGKFGYFLTFILILT